MNDAIIQLKNRISKVPWPDESSKCVTGPIDVTHQTDKDENELDDICVGHRVEPPQQCVDYGHHWGDDDGVGVGQVQDHTHSSTWNNTAEQWASEDWQRYEVLQHVGLIQMVAATDTCNCLVWYFVFYYQVLRLSLDCLLKSFPLTWTGACIHSNLHSTTDLMQS